MERSLASRRLRPLLATGFALFALALAPSAEAARLNCFDLAHDEPHTLEGVLEARVFPGSMADVETGHVSEPGYLLKLDAPLCVAGQDGADPNAQILEVEVRPTEASEAAMRQHDGARVRLDLSHPYAATTVHDHRPLVASVESLVALADAGSEASPGGAVARAFYQALASGDGARAAALIAPDKRRGALAPAAMSKYYGGLRDRLKLEFVLPQERDRYLARYTFTDAAAHHCDGRAVVTTKARGAQTFIEYIDALDGC